MTNVLAHDILVKAGGGPAPAEPNNDSRERLLQIASDRRA